MSQSFGFDGSFEDLARQFKDGIKEFARGMADEIRSHEAEFGRMNDEFGRMHDSFKHGERKHGCGPDFSFRFDRAFGPRFDRYRAEDGSLVFEFMLAGFDESCLDLSFRGDLMILKATLPEQLRARQEDGRRRPFLRDIERSEHSVPADRWDQAAARAAFRNGLLTVTIPAKEEDMSGAVKVEIVKEGN